MSRKITLKRLENIALYYLEKYSSSSANLRKILKRRVTKEQMKGAEIPEEAEDWIGKVVARMVELGYVNDKHYKEDLISKLKQQGKSSKQIRIKLLAKGVTPEFESSDEEEYQQALIFIRKKKLGFYHGEKQQDFYQKDMQKMGLAGFSYSVIRKVLSLTGEDAS